MDKVLTFGFLLLSCGICLSSSSALPQLVAVKDDQSCSVCRHVLGKVTSGVMQGSRPSDQERILISMVSSCDSLTDLADSRRCSHFVETFGVTAIDYLLSGQKQETVCDELGVCAGDSKTDQAYNTNIVDGLNPFQPRLQSIKADARCELCKFFVELIDKALDDPKNLQTVNTTLMGICNSLTDATMKTFCLMLEPQIIKLIAQGLDPSMSCQAANFCPAQTKSLTDVSGIPGLTCDVCNVIIDNMAILFNTLSEEFDGFCWSVKLCQDDGMKPLEAQAEKNSNTLECEICEFLVNTADSYLQNNKSEAAINVTIYRLCNDLPTTFKPICLAYAPQIIAALAKGLDPQKVCVEVKLCTGNGTKSNNIVKAHPKNIAETTTVECELCEFIVSQVDNYINNKNFTPTEVNNTVFGLCNDLPISFKPFCDFYAQKIVNFLIAGVDPGMICTELKLCSGSSSDQHKETQFQPKLTKEARTSKVGNFECDICEFIVANADAYLQNKTSADINNTVYGLCKDLPAVFQGFCFSYAAKIVAVLESGVDPVKACTEIKLCTADMIQERESFEKTLTAGKLSDKAKVGGLECDICEFIVNEADSYIKNKNFTPAEVNNTVFGLCNNLPAVFRSFCYVYAPKIVMALVNGVDPVKVCTEIKLCTTDRILERVYFQKTLTAGKPNDKSKVGGLECDICEFIVNEADSFIKNKNFTPAEVNNTVYGLCNDLPAVFRSFCYEYAPKIVMALVNGVDPVKVCTEIKLCTTDRILERVYFQKTLTAGKFKDKSKVGGLECDICEFIVNAADSYLKNKNFTPAEVNNTVFGLCNDLPAAFRSFCYVYAPKIVMALVNGVDPVKVCTEIKLCTTDRILERKSFQKTLTAGKPNDKSKVGGLECDICEFIVNEADSFIKNKNFTPAEVNNTVYGLCNDLPAVFRSFCYEYAPKIVMALVNGVDPVKVCTEIKLCTTDRILERKSFQKTLTAGKPKDKSKVGGLECDICEFIVNEADSYIKNKNFTPAEVNNTVFGLCNNLPAVFRSFCYVYAPKIVMALVNGVDPVKVCTEIKLCTSVSVGEKSSNIDTSLKCELCELIVKEVDYYLKGKNQSKFELNQTVFGLCDQLPRSYRKYCYSEAPSIVNFLLNGADPKEVCSKLSACVSQRKLTYFQELLKLGGIECEACKILFATLDDDLYKHETKVQGLLNEVCHRLPPPTDKKCLEFVTADFDDLWEKFLSKVLSPDGVCKLLKLCK